MANKKVVASFEIVAKGKNIKVVAKDVDKLGTELEQTGKQSQKTGKDLDKLNKNANSTRRGLHGAAGMSSSATKNFAKMSQGMGGQGGIVAAYATLAANVFAASAAFGALRSAAAFEQLVEGFTFMANEAGRNVDLIVGRLKDITGQALSTEQALQGASLALSAGFKTEQLETLTLVARGASLALGRNLGDAFDRLTRGAIKLEPEILDELGIMVRLDRAVENYAATLEKSANQLTQFERQTAFLNAINEQGIKKYGALAKAVDTNPYDRLAAAFASLTKSGLGMINTFLVPLIEFLAKSIPAMLGVLVLFASTIVGQMIPALGQMAVSAKEAAKQQRELADAAQAASQGVVASARKTVLGVSDGSKAFQKFQAKVAVGTQTQLDLDRQLTNAQARLRRAVAKKEGANQKDLKLINLKTQAIQKQIAAIQALRGATQADMQASMLAAQATAKAQRTGFRADALESIGQKRGFSGFGEAFKQTKGFGKLLGETTTKATGFRKILTSVGNGFRLAGAGAQFFGFALVNAIPLIGQIIFAIGLLTQAFQFLKNQVTTTNEGLETLATLRKDNPEIFDQLNFQIAEGTLDEGDTRIKQIKAASGVLGELEEAITAARKEAGEGAGGGFFAGIADAILGPLYDTAELADGTKITQQLKNSIDENLRSEVIGSVTDLLEREDAGSKAAREALNKELMNIFGVDLESVLETVQNISTEEGFTKLITAFGRARDGAVSLDEGIKNLGTGLSEGEKVFAKFFLAAAPKTEFDDLVKQLTSLDNEIKGIAEEGELEALTKVLEEGIGKSLESLGVNADNARTKIPELITSFKGLQQSAITLQDDLKTLAVTAKELQEVQNIGFAGAEASLRAQQGQAEKRLTLVKEELRIINLLSEDAKKKPEIQSRINKLTSEELSLTSQIKTEMEIMTESLLKEIQFRSKLVNLQKTLTAETAKQAKLNNQAVNFILTGSAEETQIQRLKREKQEREDNLKLAKETAKVERGIAEATFLLEQAKLQSLLDRDLISKEAGATILQNLEDQRDLQVDIANAKLATVRSQNILNSLTAQGVLGDGLGLNLTESSLLAEKMAVVSEVAKPLIDQLNSIDAAAGNALTQIILLAEAFGSLDETIATLTENLSEQVEAGGFDLASALGLTQEELGGMIAGIMLTIQAVETLSATQAALSANRIKGIDNEIAAEKRRDGVSAASQAKIAQLEKKKLALQKKQFEIDKKLKMAQAVMSTAVGITQVIGIPFIGPALAAMVAAVGAAQLAMISSMSFQGGAASVSTPSTSLSIGQRSNAVDVAQGATSGELGYLRGTSSTASGGAGVSAPGAAMGRKGYADGGVIVGERGPELITPTVPVDVTPNFELGGQPTNVNFTINAIDAQGVEEVLEAQQGNIIRMIRQAANENGQNFLPEVDTMAYGSKT